MEDRRVTNLARLVVDYSQKLKKGDRLRIDANLHSIPLLNALHREAVKKGAHVIYRVNVGETSQNLLREGSEEQLGYIPGSVVKEYDECNRFVTIMAPVNTRAMTNVDPGRIAITQEAAREIKTTFLERMSKGKVRWTGVAFPTNGQAQESQMSLLELEGFIFSACFADDDDPVSRWVELSKRQGELVRALSKSNKIRVEAEGTDIEFRVGGRKWENADGKKNMPDGEVFTSPVEDATVGRVSFSFPAIYMGRRVEGVQLEFKGGEVVSSSAREGKELLEAQLSLDDGAKRLGELAFGTNPNIQRYMGSTLFDEKIGGTMHVALGTGFPGLGSKNVSGIHWDMVLDLRKGGVISADGVTVQEDGKWLI